MDRWAVVTGGAGFLGRAVVNRLVGEGLRVLVLDDLSTPGASFPRHHQVRPVQLDLVRTSKRVLLEHIAAVTDGRIAEVWHLASPASPQLYKHRQRDTLALGGRVLEELLHLADQAQAPLLFASSSEVYGDPEHEVQREDDPTRVHPTGPRGMYDLAKAYGEALCAAWHHERGVNAKIARIFNTYGPRMDAADGRVVSSAVWSALTGIPFALHGSGEQTRTFGYVTDTVDGLFRIMRHGYPAKPYNIGGVETLSVNELLRFTRTTLGADFGIVQHARQDEHDPMRRRPDLSRVAALGWKPTVRIVEGLKLTAEWMVNEIPVERLLPQFHSWRSEAA